MKRFEAHIREAEGNCETHGPFVARYRSVMGIEHGGQCPACFARARAERDAEEAEHQRRTLARQVQAHLDEAGIPFLYREATIGTLGPALDEGLAWLVPAVAGESRGPLVMPGSVGIGKTHAGIALLREAIVQSNLPGAYITAADYCREIRERWHEQKGGKTESDVFWRYAKVPWMFLDDLGAGKLADIDLLQELVAKRYERGDMRRTLFATNIAPSNFVKMFGDRVADRLKDGATQLVIPGVSRRKIAT